jgi:hypothetical protein
MGGDIEVPDSAASHFHDHENIQHPEPAGYRDEEIAGQQCLSVIADKGPPALRRRLLEKEVAYNV